MSWYGDTIWILRMRKDDPGGATVSTARTPLEIRLLVALKRITAYQTPDRLRRNADKQYGLSGEEAIEMAYENMQQEARNAIRGVRLKRKPTCL
jgi:hypothetical protein